MLQISIALCQPSVHMVQELGPPQPAGQPDVSSALPILRASKHELAIPAAPHLFCYAWCQRVGVWLIVQAIPGLPGVVLGVIREVQPLDVIAVPKFVAEIENTLHNEVLLSTIIGLRALQSRLARSALV